MPAYNNNTNTYSNDVPLILKNIQWELKQLKALEAYQAGLGPLPTNDASYSLNYQWITDSDSVSIDGDIVELSIINLKAQSGLDFSANNIVIHSDSISNTSLPFDINSWQYSLPGGMPMTNTEITITAADPANISAIVYYTIKN